MRGSDPTAASIDESPGSPGGNCFFVGGIQRHITQQDLERYFGGFGHLETITLKRDSAGNSRGYGWVQYRGSPVKLTLQEAHVLKGVLLTVEQARNTRPDDDQRHHPDKRQSTNNGGNSRRRRRSRSRSRSSSLSDSTSSAVSRRGNRRRYSMRQGRSDDNTRLSSIAVGGSRLPPLSSHWCNQPPSSRPPVSPPSYSNLPTTVTATAPMATTTTTTPSSSNQDTMQVQTTMSVNDTYLCIPLTLCPPEYLSDPRTFCARLDRNRIGNLSIVPAPLVPLSAGPAMVPPPPPPAEQPGEMVVVNKRNSGNKNGPPPPGPPPGLPNMHGGMLRTMPH